MRSLLLFLNSSALLLAAGCHGTSTPSAGESDSTAVLRMATTTSTRDSGLLDELLPLFATRTGARVDVIAVGTGHALRLGELGEVDVVFVHAEAAELEFMAAGHGTRREPVMFNSFVIAGPAEDPVGIAGASPMEALHRIATGEARFVSRGDESGTHKRELELWDLAGGRPEWTDYIESGAGMGRSLIVASELQAYVLVDSGTFRAMRAKLDLTLLVTEGTELQNPYSVMIVDPAKHPSVQRALAEQLLEFLISEEIQERIAAFEDDEDPLFVPLRLGDR